MTSLPFSEPLEALPLPAGSITLDGPSDGRSARNLAVLALQQAMADRRLELPLGPSLALDDPDRLLSLNRVGVQLAISGISADQIPVDARPWDQAITAPQLLLAALVDEENGVVSFPGVLTGSELIALASHSERQDDHLPLDTDAFLGGLDRLFTLVQLLDPAALPRLALQENTSGVSPQVVAVVDWISGQLDGALAQLFGAQFQPVTQGAFFSGGAAASASDALALVAIPLGLDGPQLVCGEASEGCIERFVLQMIATGHTPSDPDGLLLRLGAAMAGDLLPDGLSLQARQGSHEQRQQAQGSLALEMVFQGGPSLIDVRISYPGSPDLVLPSLQLPG